MTNSLTVILIGIFQQTMVFSWWVNTKGAACPKFPVYKEQISRCNLQNLHQRSSITTRQNSSNKNINQCLWIYPLNKIRVTYQNNHKIHTNYLCYRIFFRIIQILSHQRRGVTPRQIQLVVYVYVDLQNIMHAFDNLRKL